MADYRIDFDPIAAAAPVTISGTPHELPDDVLWGFADQIAETIPSSWEANVAAIHRTDIGTPIERPES